MPNELFSNLGLKNLPESIAVQLPVRTVESRDFSKWCTGKLGVSPQFVRQKLQEFLEEDHGGGCATLIGSGLASQPVESNGALACVLAKDDFVICGLPLISECFRLASDGQAQVFSDHLDGQSVKKGQVLLVAIATPSQLLLAERVALNLSSHLSGITTYTSLVVAKIKSTCEALGAMQPTLLETRKTTPGLRTFEKYATRLGGARNHRHSLDTGAMLKENHLRAFGGVQKSLETCIQNVPFLTKIEIEVSNLNELSAALKMGANVVMLDNFTTDEVKLALQMRKEVNSLAQFELSGNLDRKNLAEICSLGIDFLSMGALIHQATWVDMSLQLFTLSGSDI